MLTPTTNLTQASSTPIIRRSLSPGAPALQPQTSTAATNGRSNDQLNLSQTSQARNPYQGTAPAFSSVKVDSWGKGDNDSVVQILLNQGFTQQEIYGKSGSGKTLLDEVTRVNGLRNANLIRAGQELVVPSKQAPAGQPEPAAPPTAPPVSQTPEPPASRSEQPAAETPVTRNEQPIQEAPVERTERATEPRVNQVQVDRWGQGPNSSLGAILKSQGFDHDQIFAQDANGDSLLKKVARANGLKSPDKIFAGSSLQVPNSMEALGQMDIPEMPARLEPPAAVGTPTDRTEVEPPSQPPRIETPRQPEAPRQTEAPRQPGNESSEPTANMGMLLDGVKTGKFNREEFQYLNARSSRYVQMRARYSGDGYSNDELTSLGQMERRYGVEFARLSASDDVALPAFPQNTNNPDLVIQVKHYHESGPMYDSYSNGTMSSETAIQRMVRQRDEARRQEVQ
jgi:LysM repeat protein